MADLLVRASIRGAGTAAKKMRAAQREVQDAIVAEIRGIGEFAEQRYKAHVPRDLDTAHDSIRAVPSFRARRPRVEVTIHATRDGFNYLRATREGQRVAIIKPVRARFLAAKPEGRRVGKVLLRRQVRAARPARDWVEEAGLEVGGRLNLAEQRIARRVESRFG